MYSGSEIQKHNPSSPIGPICANCLASPTLKQQGQEYVQHIEEREQAPNEMKATLGFLPPRSSQPSQLTRTRKSKSKKNIYRRMEG